MLMDGITYLAGADFNYDIAGSTLSKPTDALVLMRFSVNRPFTLPVGMDGSNAESAVAPAAAVEYSIQRNGTEVGTINFALGVNDASFVMASATAFVVDDILTVVAPSTADTAHDGISWTFKTVAS